jgi:TPR repeat protein
MRFYKKCFHERVPVGLILPLFLTLLLLPSVVIADKVDPIRAEALAAYRKGDYQTALKLWQPYRDQGDDFAQELFGDAYEHGKGVKQNYAEAAKWYRKSAEQGNSSAQRKLGILYRDGKGVKQDDAEAQKWFHANDLRRGIAAHARNDDETALKLCRLMAAQGNAEAQFYIGRLYEEGGQDVIPVYISPIKQDWVEAYYWYSLAVHSSNDPEYAKARHRAESHLTEEQISAMNKRADEWKPTPASTSCQTAADCKNFCKGAGRGKECLPDGVPVCEKNVCSCGLTCR